MELHACRPHTWLDRLPSLLTAQEATGSEERMSDALARTCLRAGDLDRALDAATRLTTLGEKHAMPLTRHAGLSALATVLVVLGRYDEAVARGTEALAAHRETGYRLREARTLCTLGDAVLAAGGTRRTPGGTGVRQRRSTPTSARPRWPRPSAGSRPDARLSVTQASRKRQPVDSSSCHRRGNIPPSRKGGAPGARGTPRTHGGTAGIPVSGGVHP